MTITGGARGTTGAGARIEAAAGAMIGAAGMIEDRGMIEGGAAIGTGIMRTAESMRETGADPVMTGTAGVVEVEVEVEGAGAAGITRRAAAVPSAASLSRTRCAA